MFAGRYMWWVLVSTAFFLFFSVYFPGFSTAWIMTSGCDATANGCGYLKGFLEGFLRPTGYLMSGFILLSVTAIRLRYLRLSFIWVLFFVTWFFASTEFFTSAGNMWVATGGMRFVMDSLPPEALYLTVLTLYLCFPMEDYERPAEGILKGVQWLALFLAGLVTLLSLVQSAELARQAYFLTGSLGLMQWLEQVRLWVVAILVETGVATVPHSILFLVFLVLIGLQGILQVRPLTAA